MDQEIKKALANIARRKAALRSKHGHGWWDSRDEAIHDKRRRLSEDEEDVADMFDEFYDEDEFAN